MGHYLWILVVAMFGESVMGKWKMVLEGKELRRVPSIPFVIQGSGHNPATSSVAALRA